MSVGWTEIVPYPGSAGMSSLQLLMDGTLLAQDYLSTTWRRFYPDPVLGYAGGSWQITGSSHYARNYFATGMLRDGRYFVGGGEATELAGVELPNNQHNKCELYNPSTGTWSDALDFPSDGFLGDGVTAPLPDGTLLVGAPAGESQVFDSSRCPMNGTACSSGAWSATVELLPGAPGGTNPGATPVFSEGSIVSLQTGDVFLTQRYSTGASNQSGAAVYHWNGASPKWQVLPHGPLQGPVQDPYNENIGEGASALTLPDGSVFIASGSGLNATYDPTPGNPDPVQNTISTPGLLNMAENCQVVMPTGKLLLVVNPQSFSGTYTFYEFDSLNGFVSTPAGGPGYTSANVFQTPLPDGTTLVTGAQNLRTYIYRSGGSQLSTNKPNIISLAGFTNGQYTISGTGLNGVTNGANRDDEGQNFTSFPSVAITSGTNTWYGSITSLSSMSIAPNAPVTAQFIMPPSVPHGSVTVTVSASGFQSANSVVVSNTLWLPTPAQFLLN